MKEIAASRAAVEGTASEGTIATAPAEEWALEQGGGARILCASRERRHASRALFCRRAVLVDLVLMANEDIARHKADRLVNGQEVTILRATGGGGGGGGSGASAGTELGGSVSAAEWLDGTWADVREGDVVRVDSHEAFPADLLLLRSSTGRECWVRAKPPHARNRKRTPDRAQPRACAHSRGSPILADDFSVLSQRRWPLGPRLL
eukprot:6204324-Pleurochrysis_carterae.AAC.3